MRYVHLADLLDRLRPGRRLIELAADSRPSAGDVYGSGIIERGASLS
jgi:hypothetical protein